MVKCLPLDPVAQVRFPPRVVGIFLNPVTFLVAIVEVNGLCFGHQDGMSRDNSVVPSRFWDESILSREICSRYRYITHFYCLAVEASFYSDVVKCLPLDLVAQVRIPPQAVRIFLHPATFILQVSSLDHIHCKSF